MRKFNIQNYVRYKNDVEAAIKNVALESGSVLLLNKEEVLKEARTQAIGILGFL